LSRSTRVNFCCNFDKTPRMLCQYDDGINWRWYRITSGERVAVFRLHYERHHDLMDQLKKIVDHHEALPLGDCLLEPEQGKRISEADGVAAFPLLEKMLFEPIEFETPRLSKTGCEYHGVKFYAK
jgi:hypothetical protein